MPRLKDSFPLTRNSMFSPGESDMEARRQESQQRDNGLRWVFDPFERGSHNEDNFPGLWKRKLSLEEMDDESLW